MQRLRNMDPSRIKMVGLNSRHARPPRDPAQPSEAVAVVGASAPVADADVLVARSSVRVLTTEEYSARTAAAFASLKVAAARAWDPVWRDAVAIMSRSEVAEHDAVNVGGTAAARDDIEAWVGRWMTLVAGAPGVSGQAAMSEKESKAAWAILAARVGVSEGALAQRSLRSPPSSSDATALFVQRLAAPQPFSLRPMPPDRPSSPSATNCVGDARPLATTAEQRFASLRVLWLLTHQGTVTPAHWGLPHPRPGTCSEPWPTSWWVEAGAGETEAGEDADDEDALPCQDEREGVLPGIPLDRDEDDEDT